MNAKSIALLILASGTLFAETHVSFGVYVGAPVQYRMVPVVPAPVVVHGYRPSCPGPGYVWIDGYYGPYRNWIAGYWAMPPYAGAYWVAPRFYGGRYTAGYWGGARVHSYSYGDGWRQPAFREHGGGYDRGHGRAVGHNFKKGFRH